MVTVTLESLLNPGIDTDSIRVSDLDFESVMFDYSDVMIEGADLDVEVATVLNAQTCTMAMESVNMEAANRVGEALKKVAHAIVKFLYKLLLTLRNILLAPITIIINLVKGNSFKQALEVVKLGIKVDNAEVDEIFDWAFKITPSQETIERRRKLMDEMTEFLQEMVKEAKIAVFTSATNAGAFYHDHFDETYSDHNHSQSYGEYSHYDGGNAGSYGPTDATDEAFKKKFEDFKKNYDDIVAGKKFCTSGEDLQSSFNATKESKLADTREKIRDCENVIKIIEKKLNGKEWETMSENDRQRCVKMLNRIKVTLSQITVMAKDEAVDVKNIFEVVNRLAKEYPNINNAA